MRFFSLAFLVFIACTDGNKTLPNSTGENSEVIFVVDDALWENSVDSLAKNTFGATIEGISQAESLFRIVQISHSEFKSILKTHTNIVIVSEGVKKSSQKDKWATGQFVAQLNWENNPQKLLKELIELRTIFVVKEVKSIKNSFEKSSQKNIEKTLLSNFGIELTVPKEYQIIKNDSTLFWANCDPPKSDEIKNIFTFSFIPKTTNLQAEVLYKTDSIFAKYLVGAKEGSYARIEPAYPPYYFENTYRGLWKLEHGFMGGPFLIKTYFVKNKIVVNVGIVFAPQIRKRKYIKEFEAIL
jgi:hypothetical protein